MNQLLENAIVQNLAEVFVDNTIFTGKVIQNVQPDNIIVRTVIDNFEILSPKVRNRDTSVQITIVSPTEDENVLKDKLSSCLMSFTINGEIYQTNTISFLSIDDFIHATINVKTREIIGG